MHPSRNAAPAWMRFTLWAAAAYNIAWGGFAIVFPLALFSWAGMEPPRYPQLWQCIGMIVGVYGIGYAIAASDPVRHWPIVLVGLLGKIFGPIGFAWSLWSGALPPAFGATILTNDLIWWLPFGAILWHALSESMRPATAASSVPFEQALSAAKSQHGVSLLALSQEAPHLVVFLRHAGCIFCRETLAELAERRGAIESNGTQLALVHMTASDAEARAFFAGYGLDDASRFADPQTELYRAFGLQRGRLGQLFGLTVWWRGFKAFLHGHGVGQLAGDGFQMPGAFLVHRGAIVRAFRHATAGDRPDYCELATTGDAARTDRRPTASAT